MVKAVLIIRQEVTGLVQNILKPAFNRVGIQRYLNPIPLNTNTLVRVVPVDDEVGILHSLQKCIKKEKVMIGNLTFNLVRLL
jgi:hypothetical protein